MIISIVIVLCIPLLYFISVYPATIASYLIKKINSIFKKERKLSLSFWTLLDKIKRQRLVIMFILFILLAGVICANFYFFYYIYLKSASVSGASPTYSLIMVISFVAMIVYSISEIIKYGKINIPQILHERSAEFRQIIDNLAITIGQEAPDFKVLSFNNLTAFSIYSNFARPVIYITAPLLSMADKNELAAIAGHEMAHIYSGRALYFKRVNNILVFLRAFSYFFLLLFLWNADPSLPLIWLAFLVYIIIENSVRVEELGEKSTITKGLITLFNPPYAIIKFLTYYIYYSIARNEDFYADLKTVEFTRYPAGIYSVLNKISNYKGHLDKLPEKFAYLYFTGENTIFEEMPMAQPTISEREDLIDDLDQTLKQGSEEFSLKCANCRSNLADIETKGLYGNHFESHFCDACSSFWFDGYSLWNINLDEEDFRPLNKQEIKFSNKLICPRCSSDLKLIKDDGLPVELQIWHCQTCQGDWISDVNLALYKKYRRGYLKD